MRQALWGFGHGARGGYPVQEGAQLKRYGTNVAIWGFNVFALHDFNDLGGGKNGRTRALDNLRAISLGTRKRQHRRAGFKRTSKVLVYRAEPGFDFLVKIAAVLSDVTGCAHWFVCRYFSQAAI